MQFTNFFTTYFLVLHVTMNPVHCIDNISYPKILQEIPDNSIPIILPAVPPPAGIPDDNTQVQVADICKIGLLVDYTACFGHMENYRLQTTIDLHFSCNDVISTCSKLTVNDDAVCNIHVMTMWKNSLCNPSLQHIAAMMATSSTLDPDSYATEESEEPTPTPTPTPTTEPTMAPTPPPPVTNALVITPGHH